MRKTFSNLERADAGFICICAVLVIIQVWLDLTMPDYTQKLTQAVSSGELNMSEVLKHGGSMLLCALGSLAASLACGFFAARVAAGLARTLRKCLFDKIINFGSREINTFTTPSLITRTTNDVVQVQNMIAMGLQMIIKAPILAIWAILKISATNILWTSATLVTVFIMAGWIGLLIALCLPRFKKIQTLTDKLNDVTRENISGVRVVRAFNAESYQEAKFERVNDDITRNNLFTGRAMGSLMPVLQLCMSALTLAVYWIGAHIIEGAPLADKAVQMGNMTAFTQYALQVVMAFMMLVMIFFILPRTMVSARRISEVLECEKSIRFRQEGAEADSESSFLRGGAIEFRRVSFGYADAGHPYIKDISFHVKPGETVAIIGATGSGKSTILNLIPRFYDVSAGTVLINGKDVREYSETDLTQQVAIAPQKAVLFKGDVKTNIVYGSKDEISDDDPRIERALRIASADFVLDSKEGIHSPVSQGGSNLSGGQKQRLSIARAVFKDAPILIFDDSFSALDYKTDMLVRKSIKEQLSGTTILIVAQRIGTIKNADRIIVIDAGEIVGSGSHEKLLDSCPIYREIALSQLSEEEL